MYIYVRNLRSAKTGVTLTSIHIDIKKKTSVNSIALNSNWVLAFYMKGLMAVNLV